MILVTLANGNQGGRLVSKLAGGQAIRAWVHTEASAERLRTIGVQQVCVGNLADPDFITRIMQGVTSVYHIGPTLHLAERNVGFAMIGAARAVGVNHFVLSSLLHAITTDLIQHEIKRDLEEHLLSSGLEFTILQPANYMLPLRMKSVFEEGVFRLSWSLDRSQSMVDLDDVTDVAAIVLMNPKHHAAATYELVAPGRFTGHDIERVLSNVLAHKVRVERIDLEAFVKARFGDRDPVVYEYQAKASRAIEKRYSNYEFIGNPNVLGWLLGRTPATFEDFARKEYVALLKAGGRACWVA